MYKLNYGYLPNTIAQEGEKIDAYVVGVDYPIKKSKGIVIAIFHRKNDIENKLVVKPASVKKILQMMK